MSSEDGSRAGAPDVEKTLVAALGFEPTAGLSDDAADLLVDDGSGDALDWSSSDPGSDLGDSDIEVQETDSAADGASAAASKSPAKASDSTMTPPKGKGKGPRTYKNTPKKGGSGSASGNGKGESAKSGSSNSAKKKAASAKEDASTSSVSTSAGDKTSGAPKTVRVSELGSDNDVDVDVDPADLIDADSSGVKPVATVAGVDPENDVKPWTASSAKTDVKAEASSKGIPAKTKSQPSSTGNSKLHAGQDETGPLPAAGLDDTGPLPAMTGVDEPPPPVVDDAINLDAASQGVVADATSLPAAETLIVEAPPTAPVAPVEEVAPAAPVVDPPPPAVGDPVPDAGAGGNGYVADPGAVGRVATGPGIKGDLASRVPQLLDQGFLKRTRRVRARKVRRVVRHIDPWSILTFSVLFFLCLFSALLLASVLVWNAAVAAGTIENIESFIREIGDYQTYEIKGDVVFQAAMVIAGILTLAASVMVVLLVVVFNLISDLVGGIRVTVVEEETVRVRRRQKQ